MLVKRLFRLYHAIVFIIFLGIFVDIFAPTLVEASPMTNVFINEIHYDNNGEDQNEFIELAGIAGLNLDGWSLHFYNGSNGKEYKANNKTKYTFTDLILADSYGGFGFAAVNLDGLQNGSSDAIALVDPQDKVTQFLSYEGVLTANSGVAAGLESIDIGVSESNNTPVGYSLQLTGQGASYQDFTWGVQTLSTFSQVNTGQVFLSTTEATAPAAIPVNEPKNIIVILLVATLITFVKPKHRLSS